MEIIYLRDNPEYEERAVGWFHEKWHIPKEAYRESMDKCLKKLSPVPQWYLMTDGGRIVGGMGVIENDFHDRHDLTPNVCAVYTEPDYRNQGIARRLMEAVYADMADMGIETLYLLTDHTSLYERYGWELFCMVRGDGEECMSRMYIHRR